MVTVSYICDYRDSFLRKDKAREDAVGRQYQGSKDSRDKTCNDSNLHCCEAAMLHTGKSFRMQ